MPTSVPRRLARATLVAVAALLGACVDGTGPDRGPGVHVVSGPGADTVHSILPDLVVEVRGADRAPLADFVVEFTGMTEAGASYVNFAPSGPIVLYHLARTDTRGRAAVPIRLGHRAGTATVTIRAGTYETTATYAIEPGAVARITVTPADTALYVGGVGRLRGTATDRWGNPRGEAVSFGSATPDLLSVGGGEVRALAIGRGVLTASVAGATGQAQVSVVPRGTLALRDLAPTSEPPRRDIVVMNLDGSQVRSIFLDGHPENLGGYHVDMGLEWTPAGTEIAFHDGYPSLKLWAVDLQERVRPLLPAAPTPADVAGPRYSRDGGWIYFNAAVPSHSGTSVWRVRPDGADAQRLTPAISSFGVHDLHPSPSPDGRRIVYGTNREGSSGAAPYSLKVMTVATREVRGLGVAGDQPRWSPTSDLIAYWRDYRLWVVRPDGTGERALTPAGVNYERYLSWSPDGEWIAATGPGPFTHLVHVESGMVLPLGFTGYMRDPAWRP